MVKPEDTHPVDVHVGQRMRLRRNQLRLGHSELGRKIGRSPQQVQKYENGENRISSSMLYEIALALEVQPGWFFDGVEGNNYPVNPVEVLPPDENELLDGFRPLTKAQKSAVKHVVFAMRYPDPTEGSET